MDSPAVTGPSPGDSAERRRGALAASLTALGVVYGDLGTSPLYTYQTIVGVVGGHPSARDAIGLLSLVVWALLITVSLKYCVLVMRADNHGEGGILALMSLVTRGTGRGAAALVVLGLFGAALIYGDGVITPAISVLSALEGINVATTALKPYVLPAAIVILFGLFAVQAKGTAVIGRVFGPVMLIWFVTIGVLGFFGVLRHPGVVAALDPGRGIAFLVRHGWRSFIVLGGVFLAITGGEALYADMGHVGRAPIRWSWYCIVLPALLLCYAGQTAVLLDSPDASGNPFFLLAPRWAVIPLVVLATFATIIASQAIITGAFSLTRQAIQLGWLPGLRIRQTSPDEHGQIYVPFVNWAMMCGTLALTAGFGSSDRLAGAYGMAVSTTMVLTTALLFNAMRDIWRWATPVALAISAAFLAVDIGFFAANLLKIVDGGWIPLLMGLAIFALMRVWHRGVRAIRRSLARQAHSAASFLADLDSGHVPRVPGTAVFLSRSDTAIPQLMIRHVEQMKALPMAVLSLTIRFANTPRVPAGERVTIEQVGNGIWHATAQFGFIEVPNLVTALAEARALGCSVDLQDAIYFSARDSVVRSPTRPRMPGWERSLFSLMYRNAVRAPDSFAVPAGSFIEIGRQLAR
jgi:KUP system potassium uptake protein